MSDVIEYPIHPVAEMFPIMSDAELDSLGAAIKARGLKEEIWTYQGRIIDGRNRYLACKKHGVTLGPEHFREWDGEGSLVEFVCDANLERRHLTATQKAFVGAEAKKKRQEEVTAGRPRNNLGKNSQTSGHRNARSEAAAMVGVNPRYISDAERIQEASPETADACRRGEKTISQAKKELGVGQPKPRPETPPTPTGKSRVNGELVDDPPEIAELRASGKIPPNAVPVIDDPGGTTSVDGVREELEERRAIQDDISDEDWLDALPLCEVLQGSQLKLYRDEAIAIRQLEAKFKQWGKEVAAVFNKGRRNGPAHFLISRAFKIGHPQGWKACSADGGCGGTGLVDCMGKKSRCGVCNGDGYRVLG